MSNTIIHMLVMPEFKAGDPTPSGYLQKQEWADVQLKAGLKQRKCGRCGRWQFPQELSTTTDQKQMRSRKGPVTIETPVCIECDEKKGQA